MYAERIAADVIAMSRISVQAVMNVKAGCSIVRKDRNVVYTPAVLPNMGLLTAVNVLCSPVISGEAPVIPNSRMKNLKRILQSVSIRCAVCDTKEDNHG